MTLDQQRDLVRDFVTQEVFTRECLRIQDVVGSTEPFEMWPGQRLLSAKLRQLRAAKKPARLIILKTRRSGFTMGACAEMFRDVAFLPGRKGLVIADQYDPAGAEAFEYLVQFARSYRPLERHGINIPLVKALVKHSQPKRIQWGEGDVNADDEETAASRISVLSAESGDVGRGGGRHFVLGDEVAFWRDPKTTLLAVLNMVPTSPHTTVILQSTANGLGGEFYERCMRARDPLNEGGWEFLFFGWLDHALYTRPLTDPEKVKLVNSLSPEEKTLHSMMGATLEQLAWRRWTIEEKCGGSVDLFHQEYPSTPEEAFLTSGRPALDQEALSRMPVSDGSPGELELIEEPPRKRLLFRPGNHGALTIWKKPELGHMYVIGADPSKGKDVSMAQRGENPDFSVGFVIDRHSGEQVAQLRERIRPVPFGEYLALLGRYYAWAYLVPEANDAGFIDSLVRTGYPLELIYQRQRDPTDRRAATIEEIGFETTTQTREWLISAADDAIRSMDITIKSPIALGECRTFVVKPNGKKEHLADCHDDCVISLALAAIGLRFAPRKPVRTEEAIATKGVSFYGRAKRKEEED